MVCTGSDTDDVEKSGFQVALRCYYSNVVVIVVVDVDVVAIMIIIINVVVKHIS